jgi:3-oxoacyl-[acyl-carrier-protein] synthase-1
MRQACERIRKGEVELCLIGGVDSYFEPETLEWLESRAMLVREGARGGIVPGEGASMIALASDALRKLAALPSLATIQGVACSQEHRDQDQGAGLMGEGLSKALQSAIDQARLEAVVDDIYCDINGERARTTDWGFTALRHASRFRDASNYVTAAAACGDHGAASAAFNVALSVCAWQRGYARGPRALVWGASWNGLRGALLLEMHARGV